MAMIIVKCDVCGQDVRKHHSKVGANNFCNRQCYLKFHMVERENATCLHCGKQWRPTNSANANKYCSRECYNAAHSIENKNRECPACGTLFEAKSSEDKYCSWECYNENRDMPSGEEHWNWQGGKDGHRDSAKSKQWRLAIYDRDNHTCQKCHSKKDLRAHHIYAWAFYETLRYEISNGITLCDNCHKEVHKTFGYYSREKMLL